MHHGERLNCSTHFLGLLLAVISTVLLLERAAHSAHGAWAVVSCTLFALTMIAVYAASTLYHAAQGANKLFWEKIDHSAIYLLIAGTYTPVALMPLRQHWGWLLAGVVWLLAVIGIAGEWRRKRSALPAVWLYVAMGWIGLLAGSPIVANVDAPALRLLLLGAVCYSAGIVFYANDARWRHAHGIWHAFVLGGTTCHFLMVWALAT